MAAHTGSGRAALIEAAYECIAEYGYAGATTARICARSGVSTGTFFHFFPTKLDVLLGVLTTEHEQTDQRAMQLLTSANNDARVALGRWIDALLDDARDPHLSGFVAAVSALPHEQRVQKALADSRLRSHELLTGIIRGGQVAGQLPAGRSAEDLAVWVDIAANGFLARVAEDSGFAAQTNAGLLREMIFHLLQERKGA